MAANTIASWTGRLDEEGDGLLATRTPVNKYPDYLRYVVQRLQTLCPLLGKVKIAQVLARAGLHFGRHHRRPHAATTPPPPVPAPSDPR